MSYKILCDSPKCEREAAIPESNMVPPGWILIKRATGGKSFCSDLCSLDEIRDSIITKNKSVTAETQQPSIEEASIEGAMRQTVPREGYDKKRRDILSPHRRR